jgi:hypothetical protein
MGGSLPVVPFLLLLLESPITGRLLVFIIIIIGASSLQAALAHRTGSPDGE